MKIAALIPCFNEEITIEKVINDLRRIIPESTIYVFDNNSTDNSAQIAMDLGTEVIKEKRQGKGYVVQSMFEKIDADIYIMVDGDDTYDLSNINEMIEVVKNDDADMVVGNRLKVHTSDSFRPLHLFGNKLVRYLINRLFRANLQDIMSGLRVMNKKFVKNINILSSGFEVETEMTIKALKYGFVIRELTVRYKDRPSGSYSKLNTFSDGYLVLKTIFIIFKDYKPLVFFSIISAALFLISITSGSVVIKEFIETRYIRHVPLAIFASGTMVLSMIMLVAGVILDTISKRFDELFFFIKNKK